MRSAGFDVIGDVHGMGNELVALLRHLGYSDDGGHFAHPTRQAVFVGDLIDRGPEQLLTVRTVKAMVDTGSALVAMGNHEFNAISWHTPHATDEWRFLRERTPGNHRQHEAFLDQVGANTPLHAESVDWFRTFPMWLDLDGLRVVHACWDDASMAALPDGPTLTDPVLHAANEKGTPEHDTIETILKGPEIAITPPYRDKGGKRRDNARFAWWKPDAKTLAEAVDVPQETTVWTEPEQEDAPPWVCDEGDLTERPVVRYPADAPPVIFGHYWRTGQPTEPDAANIACVDYSACTDKGQLTAYRWSGEDQLIRDNFDYLGKPSSESEAGAS